MNAVYMVGVVFGYKGVLLLFGMLLVYETRSIKLRQINDSRFVSMSMCNIVVSRNVCLAPSYLCDVYTLFARKVECPSQRRCGTCADVDETLPIRSGHNF